MLPETQVVWCFPEAWFQEKVFGSVGLNISNNGVDHVEAFRKTLIFRSTIQNTIQHARTLPDAADDVLSARCFAFTKRFRSA